MDIDDIIDELPGCTLNTLHKEGNSVSITFVNPELGRKIKLSFEGLVFETTPSPMGKIVQMISAGNVLNFKAVSELRRQDLSPTDYKQLFISMIGSREDLKIELLCTYKNLKTKVHQVA